MDTFISLITNVHFLRPWFLLLIPVLAWLCFWLSQQSRQQTGFEQWIAPQLLSYISTSEQKTTSGLRHFAPIYLLGLAWLVVVIALAGPTWKQLPQPLHQSEQAMIIALDLSPSMMAEDNKPSRIVRARLKIQDLLTQRKDGLTALVAYAGEAHVVTPLTDDNQTIINLLATLKPGLLPIPGSNTEMAMALSKQLMIDAGLTEASIVLVTDGVDKAAIKTINDTLDENIRLYIIGLGTAKGAPIPIASNNDKEDFLRDSNNNIITVARNEDTLKALASRVNGQYLPLQANNSDIQHILQEIDHSSNLKDQQTRELDRTMDQWEEVGPLIVLLFLPVFAFMFRRGWLLTALIVISPALIPEPAYALSWDDIWLNKQQRAQKAFSEERYEDAEKGFSQHQWQGSSAYKNKNYRGAVDAFSQGDTAVDHYNRGNAHSYLGEYDKALQAYDTALEKNPDFEDAKKNKAVIEALKKQQEEQQPQNKGGDKKEKDEKRPDQSRSENQQNESQSGARNGDAGNQNQSGSDQNSQDTDNNSDQENNSNDGDEKDQEAQETSASNKGNGNATEKPEQDSMLAELSDEERQEIEQWIRKIPDDPSGLLRRKFKYEYQKRRQLYQNGQWELPENNAHERY